MLMYCLFYVKKSRSSKAEQLYIQVHGIIVLTNSDWFLDLWLEGAGPLSARPAMMCIIYNVYRSVDFFSVYYVL